MRLDRIHEIRGRSESYNGKGQKYSPWVTDYEEMCRKTILNWAFKFLPKTGISDDALKALEVDREVQEKDFEDWKSKQKNDDFGDEFTQEAQVVG